MESINILKKLRFLPREELSHLVIKIYSTDDNKLKQAIRKVAQREVRTTASFILKCDNDKLIAILAEFGDLSAKHIEVIEELFKEYQYGSNPNLFFSQLISPQWKEYDEIQKTLPITIETKSRELNTTGEDKFVDFKVLEISKEGDAIEILFEYQRRIDYIDPKTAEPAFVYSLEEGIAWVVKSLDALIIKTSSYTVNFFISKIMQEYLNCRIRSFSLHKNIINAVLGKDTLKSGNYYKLHAGPDEVEGKAIRDKSLMLKKEGRETDENYDRKSSFHKVKEIIDSETGLNVNSQQGKISIRAHLKKSDIREWALKIIGRVIQEMTQLKESDIENYLKGYKLEDIKALKEVKKGCKEIIRDVVVGVNKVKAKGKVNFSTDHSIKDLYIKAKDYFNFIFIPTCNSCGSNFYICSSTGQDSGVSLGGVVLTATCRSCGEEIVDIPAHFKCSCGKPLEGGFDENILALPTAECVDLINNMINEIGLRYKLDSNELLKFSNGEFEIINADYKFLYLFDELPAFNNIPKLTEIQSHIAEAQIHNIKTRLGEKCNFYSDSNCRNCLTDKKGNCLQRVIASFTEGDLHAHSSVEFGDISFRQNLNGSSQLIVCLAKRYNEAPKVNGDHKYTMKNNSGLLNQTVEAIFDSRIDFLGIISGADIDPRLRETLIGLAKMKHKKIVFFEKNELIRILSKYQW
jgi:hypothetical protein